MFVALLCFSLVFVCYSVPVFVDCCVCVLLCYGVRMFLYFVLNCCVFACYFSALLCYCPDVVLCVFFRSCVSVFVLLL